MMHEVEELFPGGDCLTPVWLSAAVAKALGKSPDGGRYLDKLEDYAKRGFKDYEGTVVVHEWDGIWSFGMRRGKRSSLLRIAGFYDGKDFIAIDAFTKGGQKLSRRERDRIDAVAKVKKNGEWCRI